MTPVHALLCALAALGTAGTSSAWGGGHAKISTQALRSQPPLLQRLLNDTAITFLGKTGSAASFFGGQFAEVRTNGARTARAS